MDTLSSPWRGIAAAAGLVLALGGLLGGQAPLPDEEQQLSEGTRSGESVAEAAEALRERHPDAFQAALHAREIAGRLLQAAAARPGAAAEARARMLSAEALALGGEDAEARKLLELVRAAGPGPSERARAAFELGLGQLLRERYDGAERYWKLIPLLDPGSPWAARAARFTPYFELLRTRTLPAWEAEFAAGDAPRRSLGARELAGRRAVLHFWSAASPGEGERLAALSALAKRRADVVLLGVNLDPGEERFREAVRAFKVQRPEHHDGKGFEGPLVRSLGIPRAPHYLAVGPDGKLAYAGADLAKLERALR